MNVTKRIGQPAKIKLAAHEQRIIDRAAELCGVIAANTPASSVLHDEAMAAGQKLIAVGQHLANGDANKDA